VEDRGTTGDTSETSRGPDGSSPLLRVVRKTGIGVLGGVVTVAGLVMLVTPGPGVIVTLGGLAILGREFPAAQRQLHRLRRGGSRENGDQREP
jgi:hypothetical protein